MTVQYFEGHLDDEIVDPTVFARETPVDVAIPHGWFPIPAIGSPAQEVLANELVAVVATWLRKSARSTLRGGGH
jgi:hypothetical protein